MPDVAGAAPIEKMVRNRFEQVSAIRPGAITLVLKRDNGGTSGMIVLPDGHAGGQLPAQDACPKAIHLANEMKVAIVVLDPDGIWKSEWGELTIKRDKKDRDLAGIFWGQTSNARRVVRTIIKLLFAAFLAYWINQLAGSFEVRVSKGDRESLVKAFKSIETISNNFVGSSSFKDLKIDDDISKIELCLAADATSMNGVSLCPGSHSGLGYKILVTSKKDGAVSSYENVFFDLQPDDILGWTDQMFVGASIDIFLRQMERALFNSPTSSVSQLRLCAGTRTSLSDECRFTSCIEDAMSGRSDCLGVPPTNLSSLILRKRVASLFLGDIRFGAWTLFIYTAFELLGLWLRRILPGDVLLTPETMAKLRAEDRGAQDQAEKELADKISSLPVGVRLGLGDQLMLNALSESLRAGEDWGRNDRDVGSDETKTSTHLYREHLLDEVRLEQDEIDTLGDTLLKLAFLGTVWGISAALFFARGLDSADPIQKLLTKNSMYSGIGIGFGTTILGIALSIVIAQLRAATASAWTWRIRDAYELLRSQAPPDRIRYVVTKFDDQSKKAVIDHAQRARQKTRSDSDAKSQKKVGRGRLGALEIAGAVAVVAFVYIFFGSFLGNAILFFGNAIFGFLRYLQTLR